MAQVPGASESGGQSAFNKTIGIPADAKTASDAPGNASAGNAPYDAAAGGAAGSVSKAFLFPSKCSSVPVLCRKKKGRLDVGKQMQHVQHHQSCWLTEFHFASQAVVVWGKKRCSQTSSMGILLFSKTQAVDSS